MVLTSMFSTSLSFNHPLFRASLTERRKFTEDNLELILDSANNPIDGKRWWLKGECPWQLLAACCELAEALKLPNPAYYESSIPVHQDGSCNGLQHYAALGGDTLGAEAVNLVPADRPDDVYTKVSKKVQQLVDEDVKNNVPESLLMQNRINRKLVKQTVMTNTYGVTLIGARDQVYNRLKEARENESPDTALSTTDMKACAIYITRKIFASMDHMFEGNVCSISSYHVIGAREIQVWLTNSARWVTQSVPQEKLHLDEIKFYEALQAEGLINSPCSSNYTGISKSLLEEEDAVDPLMEAVSEDVAPSKTSSKSKKGVDYSGILEEKAVLKLKSKFPSKMTSMIWTSPLGFPIVQPYRKDPVVPVS